MNEVADLILTNRKNKVEYEHGGDITRYAGDILDYMVHANLLDERHGHFYLNHTEMESIMVFINDINYFVPIIGLRINKNEWHRNVLPIYPALADKIEFFLLFLNQL